MVKILVKRPFKSLPAPLQTYPKGYKVPTSAAQVPLLSSVGYDEAKYGKPARAAIGLEFNRVLFIGAPKGQAGMIGAAGDCVWEPEFTECQWTVTKTSGHVDEAKWGEMPYGFVRPRYKRCHWYRVFKEHLSYPHLLIGGTYEDCIMEEGGGQALQVADRYWHKTGPESWDVRALTMPGVIKMMGCWISNVGKVGNGRVSECLTFFGPQDDKNGLLSPISAVGVRLEGCGIYYRTSGGGSALFQRRPYFELVPDSRTGNPGQIYYLETASKGAKPLVFSEGSQAGLIEGWTIDGGKFDVLDMPDGKLVLKDVAGQAILRKGKTQVVNGVKKTVYKTIGTFDSLRNAVV